MARKRTLAAALAAVACLQVAPAWSLGLGEITLQSFLNEPLRARVSLINTGKLHEDQIRVRLATSEDFDRLGVERAYFLTGIKFEVKLDQQNSGQILLTSQDPVLEPYLDFIIEARWPAGRLLRNYTVLVDPPGSVPASQTISASEQLAREESPQAAPEPPSAAVGPDGSSGDRVDLRRSNSASGEIPQRTYGTDTVEAPEPGARYLIRRDDTLWAIAQRARPSGASVQQTMLEIQRLNPEAFIDGNINRIKAGYIIYLPDSGDISPADAEAIREQIRRQNADWRAGRPSEPEVTQAALRLDAGNDEQSAAAPEAASPVAAGADGEGETSTASTEVATSVDVQERPPSVSREQFEQARQARDALSQQLASLSERLASLERMVDVRDTQIAELQAALAAAQAGPAADRENRNAQSAAVTASENAEAAAGNGYWWYGLGAATVAALLGLLAWRRRETDGEEAGEAMRSESPRGIVQDSTATGGRSQERTNQDDAYAGVKLQDQDMELDLDEEMAMAAPTIAPARPAAGPQRGYGERKHDQYAADVEASDALAEADIYVAYGRFPQAMELLRKAIGTDPANTRYRLRLLELAVETGHREEAEQQLAALRDIGDSTSIEAAENLLLGGAVFGYQNAGGDSGPLADGSHLADSSPSADSHALADDAAMPETPGMAEASTAPESPDFQGHLSDIGQGHLSDIGASDIAENALPIEDLSADLPDLSRPGDGLDERVAGIDKGEVELFDLEIADGNGGEDLDLGHDGAGAAISDEDDFVFAGDGDPIATKLDLARAYIDMGDEEGARDILEEVLGAGNSEQQQDARELLSRLG